MNEPAPTAAGPVAFEVFLFDRGRFVGSRIFAGVREVSIGRGSDVALRLEDPLVSGKHAILFVQDGALKIRDEGSSNGLYINGQRVQNGTIGPLDEVRLGDSRIKVEVIGAPQEDATPEPERTRVGVELSEAEPNTDVAAGPPVVEMGASWEEFLTPPVGTPLASEIDAAGGSALPAPVARGREGAAPAEQAPPLDLRGRHESGQGSSSRAPSPLPAPPGRSVPMERPGAVRQTPPPPPQQGVGIAEMLQETNEQLAETQPRKSKAKKSAPPQKARADDSAEALPYPPAPPEIDEEAEEERNHVEPFSLLESLVLDPGSAGGVGVPMVEVIRYRGSRLIDVDRVDPGGTFEITRGESGDVWRMVQLLKNGKLRLFFLEGDEGNLRIGGKRASLAQLTDPSRLVNKKQKVFAVDLSEGDRAQLWIDGAGFYLRPVRAPRPPPKRFSFTIGAEDRSYALIGAVGIFAMLAGIWIQTLIAPPELLVMEEEAQFAEISLKDLEMERPAEPPNPPEPVAEVQVPEPEPVEQPQQQPRPQPPPQRQARARPSRGAPAAAQAAAPEPSAADSALAALTGGMVPTGESKLTAAVSNIAAVRAPANTSSSFAVSGAIGKVPGDEVSLSRGGKAGGGTGRETRAAAAVLAGSGGVGQVTGGGGTGKVRGIVRRQPARSIGTSGGFLSKDAIAKVINEGLSRVQSCYERELISDPSLQGKIVFDWVIGPEGSVTTTRVSSSSLPSQTVATCISNLIKTWQFPKPSGGSVTVVYPFNFASQGF